MMQVTLALDLVDFELSDDQIALRDAARDLLDGYAGPDKVRSHVAALAPYDTTLWKAMVEQGWLGIERAEADGGLGMGFVEACVLMEQAGRHVAPAPSTTRRCATASTSRCIASPTSTRSTRWRCCARSISTCCS